jgi:hypothetical protein
LAGLHNNCQQSMSLKKFVNEAEYKVILQKVNQVMCEHSKCADQTQDAHVFLSKMVEKCATREEFLKVVEQRLDLLNNPNKGKEVIDWFVERRQKLAELLKGIKDKLSKDPNYLNRFSAAVHKGVQSLDLLLKLDVKDINLSCLSDVSRVKRMAIEFQTETENKVKAQMQVKMASVDEYFLYDKLHEVLACMNLKVLQAGNMGEDDRLTGRFVVSPWCASSVLSRINVVFAHADLLKGHQRALLEYTTKLKGVLDKECVYRLECATHLLQQFLENRTRDSNIKTEPTEFGSDISPLSDDIIYAALYEMKATEWTYLQQLRTYEKAREQASSSSAGDGYARINKKRKAQVSLEGVVIPPAAQKVLDQLQQQSVNTEAGSHAGRAEFYAGQVKAAEEALQSAPWEKVIDTASYAGCASCK